MEPTTLHATFTLEETYPHPPEKSLRRLRRPREKNAAGSSTATTHQVDDYSLDFRPGGRELTHLHFGPGTPVAGLACTNDTLYFNIVPNRRIVFASTMAVEGTPISAALVTVELFATPTGTSLLLTHQGAFFENSDGPARREQGWRLLVGRLPGVFADPA